VERTDTENTGNRGVEGADIFPVGAKPADNRLLPACQIFFYLGFTMEQVTTVRKNTKTFSVLFLALPPFHFPACRIGPYLPHREKKDKEKEIEKEIEKGG
jgi:hypothetical protein